MGIAVEPLGREGGFFACSIIPNRVGVELAPFCLSFDGTFLLRESIRHYGT